MIDFIIYDIHYVCIYVNVIWEKSVRLSVVSMKCTYKSLSYTEINSE